MASQSARVDLKPLIAPLGAMRDSGDVMRAVANLQLAGVQALFAWRIQRSQRTRSLVLHIEQGGLSMGSHLRSIAPSRHAAVVAAAAKLLHAAMGCPAERRFFFAEYADGERRRPVPI